MKTIIEPFRCKTVEPIRFTTRSEREKLLKEAGNNLFRIKAEDVIIDLLTDSGTSAMSSEQWSAMMRGDESYAGCQSFFRFQEAVQEIFGFQEVLPVHQGRAAERLFFSQTVKAGQVVPSNTHFDTTRANVEALSGQALDLRCKEAADSESDYPFKGNIDLEAVTELLEGKGPDQIPFGMITITNNACGGQPVSLDNIRQYSQLLKARGIPLIIDAARFAENAYLIKEREPAYKEVAIPAIVREIFELADGCLMSAKKDGLANMGGFIALRDPELAARLKDALILTEGFPTYGGLSGRDLEAIAVGLKEVLSEDYLRYRAASAKYMANGLRANNVPIVVPSGLHAIYIDARQFLPHIPPAELPGQVVACQLYLEAGIRTCEIGTAMFGHTDPKTGLEVPAHQDLVRLALPRRVYSQSHFDYVIEGAERVYRRKGELTGMKIVWQPKALRHFTAQFQSLPQAAGTGSEHCPRHGKTLSTAGAGK